MQLEAFSNFRAIKIVQVNHNVKFISFQDRAIYSHLLFRQKVKRTDVASTKAISKSIRYPATEVEESLGRLESLALIKDTIPTALTTEQATWFKMKRKFHKKATCLLDNFATWLCYVPASVKTCGWAAVAVWSINAHCEWVKQRGKQFLNNQKLTSQSYLANFLGFGKSTINDAFTRLEKLGIVKNIRDEARSQFDPHKIKQYLAAKKTAKKIDWEAIPDFQRKHDQSKLSIALIREQLEKYNISDLQDPTKVGMMLEDSLYQYCTSVESLKLFAYQHKQPKHKKTEQATVEPSAFDDQFKEIEKEVACLIG